MVITLNPIDWGAWGPWKLYPSITGKAMHMWRYYQNNVGVCHWLKEMGNTTNGYRYTVYFKGRALFDVRIKVKCCGVYDKCPVGRQYLRAGPCRDAMRVSAIEEAHRRWVLFIGDITALQEEA